MARRCFRWRELLKMVYAIKNHLLLQGTPSDLIDLAYLLVSLAISGETRGQHWHIDELTLMDEASEIPELILEKIGG